MPLLNVSKLTAPAFASTSGSSNTGEPLFTDLSLSVDDGDVLVIQGPSGAGKSVALKCISHLLIFPQGSITLRGQSVEKYGVPDWRCRVMYLPQRPALLAGTPAEFFQTVKNYHARKQYWQQKFGSKSGRATDPVEIALKWNVPEECWQQTWGQLSGGEAQRIGLAIALALEPEVLLLDGWSTSSLLA